tara:strand:+ start:7280 stop:8188 length:909 start_codon:yes stop_codon:yes gene_type:complete
MTDKGDIIGSFMTLFGGVFGDIIARIIYKGGSLDVWYLTFPFFFFPLSIVPFIIWLTGIIKENEGKDNPVDAWSWWLLILPPIWHYFVKIVVQAEQTEILNIFFYLFIFLLARINRKNNRCNNSNGDFSFPFYQVGASLLSMSIGSFIFDMINLLQVFVNMIPSLLLWPFFLLLKWLFTLILLPFHLWDWFACVKLLQTGISLSLAHIFLNMSDVNDYKSYNDLCTKKTDTLPIPKYFPIPNFDDPKYFAGGGFFSDKAEDWKVIIPILLALIVRYGHALFLQLPILSNYSGCPLNDDLLDM